jgi:hypothetical protein
VVVLVGSKGHGALHVHSTALFGSACDRPISFGF